MGKENIYFLELSLKSVLYDCIHLIYQSMFWISIIKNGYKEEILEQELIQQQTELILNNYGNHILRLAYSYLHNLSDAEDVLQDTLIQFMKAKPNFHSHTHEKAWLMRVAINLSKNKLKYNKIRSTTELEDSLVGIEKRDLSFVWEAVKELPIKYREVIHLYYYEGYSTNQIATILKKKESTIRSRLLRGRKKLKEVLKETYDFDETIS